MRRQLTEFAAEQQRAVDQSTSLADRKRSGHFGTSPSIAQIMASLFSDFSSQPIRILDPGAGVETLSAALFFLSSVKS